VALTVGLLNTLTPAARQAARAEIAIPPVHRAPVVLGFQAGTLHAALTIYPGQAGRNAVEVALAGRDGRPVAEVERARVWAVPAPDGRPGRELPQVPAPPADAAPAAELAEGRYRARLDLRREGRWYLYIHVRRSGGAVEAGGIALEIPVPDARLVLLRAEQAMQRLDSAVMTETLSAGRAVIRTRYAFVAPDRMHYRIEGGPETIAIGGTRYDRRPGEPWRRSAWPGAEPFRWPSYEWLLEAEDVVLLGADTAGGKPAWVLACRDPRYGAHYRLWVGVEDGRVWRLRMVAPAHFMTWEFEAFDVPLSIEPPVPEGGAGPRPGRAAGPAASGEG